MDIECFTCQKQVSAAGLRAHHYTHYVVSVYVSCDKCQRVLNTSVHCLPYVNVWQHTHSLMSTCHGATLSWREGDFSEEAWPAPPGAIALLRNCDTSLTPKTVVRKVRRRLGRNHTKDTWVVVYAQKEYLLTGINIDGPLAMKQFGLNAAVVDALRQLLLRDMYVDVVSSDWDKLKTLLADWPQVYQTLHTWRMQVLDFWDVCNFIAKPVPARTLQVHRKLCSLCSGTHGNDELCAAADCRYFTCALCKRTRTWATSTCDCAGPLTPVQYCEWCGPGHNHDYKCAVQILDAAWGRSSVHVCPKDNPDAILAMARSCRADKNCCPDCSDLASKVSACLSETELLAAVGNASWKFNGCKCPKLKSRCCPFPYLMTAVLPEACGSDTVTSWIGVTGVDRDKVTARSYSFPNVWNLTKPCLAALRGNAAGKGPVAWMGISTRSAGATRYVLALSKSAATVVFPEEKWANWIAPRPSSRVCSTEAVDHNHLSARSRRFVLHYAPRVFLEAYGEVATSEILTLNCPADKLEGFAASASRLASTASYSVADKSPSLTLELCARRLFVAVGAGMDPAMAVRHVREVLGKRPCLLLEAVHCAEPYQKFAVAYARCLALPYGTGGPTELVQSKGDLSAAIIRCILDYGPSDVSARDPKAYVESVHLMLSDDASFVSGRTVKVTLALAALVYKVFPDYDLAPDFWTMLYSLHSEKCVLRTLRYYNFYARHRVLPCFQCLKPPAACCCLRVKCLICNAAPHTPWECRHLLPTGYDYLCDLFKKDKVRVSLSLITD